VLGVQISSNGYEKEEKKKKPKCLLKLMLSMLKTCLKNITSVPPLSFCTNSVPNNMGNKKQS
jgi:hypothetical protein